MVSESGISFRYSEESTGCVNDTLDGCGLSYNNTLQHNQVGDITNWLDMVMEYKPNLCKYIQYE